jgi:hypothetical protein
MPRNRDRLLAVDELGQARAELTDANTPGLHEALPTTAADDAISRRIVYPCVHTRKVPTCVARSHRAALRPRASTRPTSRCRTD